MKVYVSIVLRTQIHFFGAIFSENGLYPDPNKAEKIKLLPSPIDVAEIQKVLGIITYDTIYLSSIGPYSNPTRIAKERFRV